MVSTALEACPSLPSSPHHVCLASTAPDALSLSLHSMDPHGNIHLQNRGNVLYPVSIGNPLLSVRCYSGRLKRKARKLGEDRTGCSKGSAPLKHLFRFSPSLRFFTSLHHIYDSLHCSTEIATQHIRTPSRIRPKL